MNERHTDTLEYFVCTGSDGQTDGTLDRPFQSLKQALESLADRTASFDSADIASRQRSVEIICIGRPGAAVRHRKKPRYHYFVDVRFGGDGDGSQLAPWSSFAVAIAGIQKLLSGDAIKLARGQRLCISHHEIFTPTDLERHKKTKESVAKFAFLLMALTCVIPVVLILAYLTYRAWPALSLAFLITNPQNNFTAGGIWAPLIGTFFLVLLSLLIAAPIGVLAGVYLNEYAPSNWFTRMVSLAVVNLAGVPSIVHALFGVGAFVLFMHMGRSLLAASCTVAVMTLPVIITSTREALAAVPMSFREACWNMGASRWQTVRTIVLPNSVAGILTGVILQVARAAGETAPILFTGAILYVRVADTGWEYWIPYGTDDRFMALSYHLYALSTQIRGASDETLFGTAVVLIGLVLAVNSLSIAVRIYLRSHKKW